MCLYRIYVYIDFLTINSKIVCLPNSVGLLSSSSLNLSSPTSEVQTMFGDLTLADGQYGGAKGRRWKVEWEKTPQPIQIK